MRPKILVCNDDGYEAIGIQKLANSLSEIAEITVVAPKTNRSGCSNSLTLDKPIEVSLSPSKYYCVDGTPSDCVHIALTYLLNFRPDMVVSGINQGQNMGEDTLYSGTVAAAIEGFLFGVPSIAFSQVEKGWFEIDAAAEAAKKIVSEVLELQSQAILLNVNIPNLPNSQLNKTAITKLGKRHSSEPVSKSLDLTGKEVFKIGAPGKVKDNSNGTDFFAVENNFISISPLKIDLTNFEQIEFFKRELNCG